MNCATLLLQSEAARDIAREIQLSLTTQQRQRLAAARQVDPKAYEAYLKGIYFSNKRSAPNFKRAIEYFQQAIEKDPNYALAYSGLSDALLGQIFTGTPSQKVRERATRTALKSVELDPSLPEVHNSLAGSREFYDWDWPSAEREYQRAIELNQNFAAAHQDYAIFLALQGRFDQAFSEAQRSQDLDPLSPFVRTTYCVWISASLGAMTRPSQNAGKLSSSIRIFSTHMVTWRVFTNPWESMTKRSRNTQNPQRWLEKLPRG